MNFHIRFTYNIPGCLPDSYGTFYGNLSEIRDYFRQIYEISESQLKDINKRSLSSGGIILEAYESAYIIDIETIDEKPASVYERVSNRVSSKFGDDFTFMQIDTDIESTANLFGYTLGNNDEFYSCFPVLAWVRVGDGDYDSYFYYTYDYHVDSTVYYLKKAR